METAISFHIW